MTVSDLDEVSRSIGRLEGNSERILATLAGMSATFTDHAESSSLAHKAIDTRVSALESSATEQRGSWKTLAWVGSAIAGLIGFAASMWSNFKGHP